MSTLFINNPKGAIDGTIALSGAKNSALKVLTAAVLAEKEVVLDNIPLDSRDVKTKLQMLRAIGATIFENRPGHVIIQWPATGPQAEVPDHFGSVRTSLLFLGALLTKKGYAKVPLPGGDRIGPRKHDLHLMALRNLGATYNESEKYIEVKADRLVGTKIEFPFRTTGGTENAILASVCAQGKTVLYNAHTRPEVLDLISFLKMLDARITVFGSGMIAIEGVDRLKERGYHAIIYDSMEAMTFAAFAIITGGKIKIRNFPVNDLEIPMIYLRESGVRFTHNSDGTTIERPGILTPFDLSTGTYPGINSDMHPLFAAMATQADGVSSITDIRFKERFQYVKELKKMGADIHVEDNKVIIKGPTRLTGKQVVANDIRGGAALVAAGLVATGQTQIEQAGQIDRGYEYFDKKLSSVGVDVKRQG
jgi:UDP-N-acetylglucosamine 1-carboxyvinyltransferase